MKNIITLLLAGIVLCSLLPTAIHSQVDPAKQQQRAEKIKSKVKELGLGERSVVSIKLYDGRKIKGYVREAGNGDFVVVDQLANPHQILYSEVSSVSGKNMSTGAKIAIGVGIGAGAALLAFYLVFRRITRNN